MFLHHTNIEAIKENVSLPFLDLDIQPSNIPFCVYHPYLESSTVQVPIDIELPMEVENIAFVDVLLDENGRKQWVRKMENVIQNATELFDLYIIVRKSYRLAFLKYAKEYMSLKDFSTYLADAWVSSENPNQDANCDIDMLISWFQQADKKTLMVAEMVAEDYKVYTSLPDELNIYRGVALGREPNGLSWTADLEKAKWFAHRFDRGDKQGYVETAIVKKEDVLAYFNTRDEDELVVNVRNLEIKVITKK